MASDNEALCESDPNFAVVCAFWEKFGTLCGLTNIDFLELQAMLENTVEVSQELIDLHIKLLRKTRKSVSSERWEKALIKFCHGFNVQDAWEIERFGYKKARLSSKLRILKELFEVQFDCNTKFKTDINKMSAEELRSQPFGKDKFGHSYWFQSDDNCQIRIYKEDPDEETWMLVAKDKTELISLINDLGDGDSKISSDTTVNEDSNSLVEKPIMDTGQVESNRNTTSDDDDSNENKLNISQFNENDDETKSNLCMKPLNELLTNNKRKERDDDDDDSYGNDVKHFKRDDDEIVGEAIEEPLMLVKGEGSGLDNKSPVQIVSETVEENVLYVYGEGNGFDCQTGNNEKSAGNNSVKLNENKDINQSDLETFRDNSCFNNNNNSSGVSEINTTTTTTTAATTDNKSTNQVPTSPNVNKFKLGTIIDTKTENKINNTLVKNFYKKSRWDVVETKILKESTELNEQISTNLIDNNTKIDCNKCLDDTNELNKEIDTKTSNENEDDNKVVKKPMFFFGPGCLQFSKKLQPATTTSQLTVSFGQKSDTSKDEENQIDDNNLKSISDNAVPLNDSKSVCFEKLKDIPSTSKQDNINLSDNSVIKLSEIQSGDKERIENVIVVENVVEIDEQLKENYTLNQQDSNNANKLGNSKEFEKRVDNENDSKLVVNEPKNLNIVDKNIDETVSSGDSISSNSEINIEKNLDEIATKSDSVNDVADNSVVDDQKEILNNFETILPTVSKAVDDSFKESESNVTKLDKKEVESLDKISSVTSIPVDSSVIEDTKIIDKTIIKSDSTNDVVEQKSADNNVVDNKKVAEDFETTDFVVTNVIDKKAKDVEENIIKSDKKEVENFEKPASIINSPVEISVVDDKTEVAENFEATVSVVSNVVDNSVKDDKNDAKENITESDNKEVERFEKTSSSTSILIDKSLLKDTKVIDENIAKAASASDVADNSVMSDKKEVAESFETIVSVASDVIDNSVKDAEGNNSKSDFSKDIVVDSVIRDQKKVENLEITVPVASTEVDNSVKDDEKDSEKIITKTNLSKDVVDCSLISNKNEVEICEKTTPIASTEVDNVVIDDEKRFEENIVKSNCPKDVVDDSVINDKKDIDNFEEPIPGASTEIKNSVNDDETIVAKFDKEVIENIETTATVTSNVAENIVKDDEKNVAENIVKSNKQEVENVEKIVSFTSNPVDNRVVDDEKDVTGDIETTVSVVSSMADNIVKDTEQEVKNLEKTTSFTDNPVDNKILEEEKEVAENFETTVPVTTNVADNIVKDIAENIEKSDKINVQSFEKTTTVATNSVDNSLIENKTIIDVNIAKSDSISDVADDKTINDKKEVENFEKINFEDDSVVNDVIDKVDNKVTLTTESELELNKSEIVIPIDKLESETDVSIEHNLQSVVEEPCIKKFAYTCGVEDNNQMTINVDVMPKQNVPIDKSKPETNVLVEHNLQPVVEEPCIQKVAYTCGVEDNQTTINVDKKLMNENEIATFSNSSSSNLDNNQERESSLIDQKLKDNKEDNVYVENKINQFNKDDKCNLNTPNKLPYNEELDRISEEIEKDTEIENLKEQNTEIQSEICNKKSDSTELNLKNDEILNVEKDDNITDVTSKNLESENMKVVETNIESVSETINKSFNEGIENLDSDKIETVVDKLIKSDKKLEINQGNKEIRDDKNSKSASTSEQSSSKQEIIKDIINVEGVDNKLIKDDNISKESDKTIIEPLKEITKETFTNNAQLKKQNQSDIIPTVSVDENEVKATNLVKLTINHSEVNIENKEVKIAVEKKETKSNNIKNKNSVNENVKNLKDNMPVMQLRRGRSKGLIEKNVETIKPLNEETKIEEKSNKKSVKDISILNTKDDNTNKKLIEEESLNKVDKLKEKTVDNLETFQKMPTSVNVVSSDPIVVDSSSNSSNSDILEVSEDPLGMKTENTSNKDNKKQPFTLSTFSLDFNESTTNIVEVKKIPRKRGRESPENVPDVDETVEKKLKMRGKRTVNVKLRKSIEEKKMCNISSSSSSSSDDDDYGGNDDVIEITENDDDDEIESVDNKTVKGIEKKGSVSKTDNVTEDEKNSTVSVPKKPKSTANKNKRLLQNLGITPGLEQQFDEAPVGVRQSRRIAQIKIKEEAERRKIEEELHKELEEKQKKKKGRKSEDKDYKVEKKKSTKIEEGEDEDTGGSESQDKKKRKKRKRSRDPRKIFDEYNPWRSSSNSSSSNGEDDEEEIGEYSDYEPETLQLKSDHEFSPESDLEEGSIQPLKRARTARKESDVEEVDDCPCQRCEKSDHPEWILLCDRCDNGWHCSCLRPPLLVIPEGDWFCPPCQHNILIQKLQEKLTEYNKKLNKKEIEDRRKERLAYVGISLNNVLPAKDTEHHKKRSRRESQETSSGEEGEEDDVEESQSGSESESDSDEPIYQLRQRRQAHSYRFNDYDELINSAIQDEMEAVKGAGNQGRGKDIATIVNAEKEEGQLETPLDLTPEQLPPVVPPVNKTVDNESKETDSDDEPINIIKRKSLIYKKKHRKLNCLDISSEDDDADSDEDFKGSSSDSEEEFDEDLGSEDSDEFDGRKRGSGPIRRSTRARTSRYDAEFIDDGDTEEEEDESRRRKKKRSIWDESESEESDRSWGRSKRKHSSGNKVRKTYPSAMKKKSKKKKKQDDSDPDEYRNKKPKIKFGGLDSEDMTRRTRGKKITYVDALGSDSEEERVKRAPPRIDSEDEYVANEEEDEELDEDDKCSEEEDDEEEDEGVDKAVKKIEQISKKAKTTNETNLEPKSVKQTIINEKNEDDYEGEEELNPIDAINKNLEEMDENEMEKMMEEEEYANKQLQLVALQIEKEKKRKEKEAKKLEMLAQPVQQPLQHQQPVQQHTPKKRGRKPKIQPPATVIHEPIVDNMAALIVNPENNDELSEPPGVSLPLFSELTSNNSTEDEIPKKRRGRGRGKKTLEEAVANLGSSKESESIPTNPFTSVINKVGSLDEQDNIEIAAPPQPFSQSQPTPSVITRMLQSKPAHMSGYPVGTIRPKQFATLSDRNDECINQGVPNLPPTSGPPISHHSLPPVSSHLNNSPGQYLAGALRNPMSSPFRQIPPNINPYPRGTPPPNPHQIRNPVPQPLPPHIYHSHRPLDPSPSGGGTVNISEHNSPGQVPSPAPSSPSSNKNDTPPPPYSRPPLVNRFPLVNNPSTMPTASNAIRHMHLVSPHLQPPRPNMSPYHPNIPSGYPYGSYPPLPTSLPVNEDAMPPTSYQNSPYSEQFSNEAQSVHPSENSNSKSFDEESGGEFGGLVSYFSSQREDDLES